MKQTKGIARLVDIKRRAAEAAEAEYAAANLATQNAEKERIEADIRWIASIEAAEKMELVSDLEQRDFHVRCLRRAVDEAEQRVTVAKSYEMEAHRLMTDARMELKRFEMWLERVSEGRKNEQKRLARIADDEVAARKSLASV